MINRVILLNIIVFLTGIDVLQAQQVLTTMGHYHENKQGSLSYTIGEPFITTLYSDENVLTQGFQQPKLLLTVIAGIAPFTELIKVYPNPAGSKVCVDINSQNPLNLIIDIFSVQGLHLFSTQTRKTLTEISSESLNAGTYLLRISHEGLVLKTVKVVKK